MAQTKTLTRIFLSHQTKKCEGQKEVRSFVLKWLYAQPLCVLVYTCQPMRDCVFANAFIQHCMCLYCSMCSYAHTVCAHSHVSVQLFYQVVTECQPLCVRRETAERRLLPSSSSHSDDYCLVIIPPLFSPHGKIWMGPPQQSSLTQSGSSSLTLHGEHFHSLKTK